MLARFQSTVLEYVGAVASIALATWLRLFLDPIVGDGYPFATYFLAVVIMARFCSFGAALTTAILGASSAAYFVLPPRGNVEEVGLFRLVGVGLFLALSLAVILLGNAMRRALERAECAAQAERAQREQLFESEQRFRRLADTAPVLIWMAGVDKLCFYFNKPWLDFTGRTPEQETGEGWLVGVHPEDRESCMQGYLSAFDARREFHLEYRLRRYDGAYRWLLDHGVPRFEADGSFAGYVGSCIDITEHRESEEKLRKSERIYRAIGESIDFGVWVCNADGKNVYASPSFLRLVGQTQEQCSEFGWGDVLHPDDAERTIAAWKECVRVRGKWDIEHRFRGVDGKWHPVLARGVAVEDEQGSVVCWAGINLDISRLKDAEAALRDLNATLEQRVAERTAAAELANQAKSQFLANMSHEIRTPMNGILGMTELLLDTELSAEQREFLDGVEQSANSLMTIINDILDFSRIEAGKIELDPMPFSLRRSLADMLMPLILRAEKKGLQLGLEVDDRVPDELTGDVGRLGQIILNLVSNAIKFTHQGEIRLSVRAESLCAAAVTLHLSVADTGIGIPAEKFAAIFAPFEQVDGSVVRRYGGTGLGLAISARLAELLGGRIWLESIVGQGSTFHFTARMGRQVAPVRDDVLAIDGKTLPLPSSVPLHILLVEDNRVSQAMGVQMLEKDGHRVTVANNGLEALAALEQAACDLILMDIQMPEMDGMAATAAIRAREPKTRRHIPIIALTAHALKGDQERMLAAGMDDYLAKPIYRDSLRQILMKWAPHPETSPQKNR